MQWISIAIGKIVFIVLRLLGRTGSALPGLVVERLRPSFLARALQGLPGGVIVVSGTNGKTTTTKILVSLLESQGLRVLTNKTGSNFVRGIVSVVVDKATWHGALPYDIAVFEQDEAHAVHFVRQVKPRGVVVLNIMRDQMDRFGEIDTTRQLLQTLVTSATEWVVLNANDERVGTLQPADGANGYWYGHAQSLQSSFLTDDQLYDADAAHFYEAATPAVLLEGYTDSHVQVRIGGVSTNYAYALQGGHNALNVTAALTALIAAVPAYDERKVAEALRALQPAFGRGEVIQLPNGGSLTLQLVKNPGGFTQALRMLSLKSYDVIGIAINDDYPDGRDVSWLWDVDFRELSTYRKVLCGGERAADMANRLKYDEVSVQCVSDDLNEYGRELASAVGRAQDGAVLFCTYTAMLKLRGIYLGTHSGLDEVEV